MSLAIVQTCPQYPEQYEVFKGGVIVGYLRARHGHFSVECPDVGCEVVYQSDIEGDGSFDDSERDHQMEKAIEAIEKWILRGKDD